MKKGTAEERLTVLDEIAASLIPPEGSFSVRDFCETRKLDYDAYCGRVRDLLNKAAVKGDLIKHPIKYPSTRGGTSSVYYSEVEKE